MASPSATSTISWADRIGLALFSALVLHAIIVFGVAFNLEPRQKAAETIQITLSQYDDVEEPEEADFYAQTNQRGSGTEAEVRELTAVQEAEVPDPTPKPVQQAASAEMPRPEESPVKEVVAAEQPKPKPLPKAEASPETPAPEKKRTSLRRSLEMASIQAALKEKQNAYAKRPRVARHTSVSAKKSSSAFYMDAWRREVEKIGNMNYPEEARRRQLNGRVRVSVMLEADGQVQAIEVLESSGHKVLDDAVIRIIRLAEPFPPFTEAMRQEFDILDIIRTFEFGSSISSF